MRTRTEEHVFFTFEGNIVYFDSGALQGSKFTGSQFHMTNVGPRVVPGWTVDDR